MNISKKSIIKKCFIAEGILAFGLAILMYYAVGLTNSMFLLTVPFDCIANGLRWLSLYSPAGNLAAILLYTLLSLLPMVYLCAGWKKAGLNKTDILLPVISLYSFYLLYEFINPGLMLKRLPKLLAGTDGLPMVKMSFAIIFYVLVIAYFMFRMMQHLKSNNEKNRLCHLCNQLQKILIIISVLYTFYLGYFMTFMMFQDFNQSIEQNSSSVNMFFVVLTYILNGLPIILSIATLVSGIGLLKAMALSHLQAEEIQAASHMGAISKYTVYVTVICNITLNVLQFIFSRQLNDTSYVIKISFIPLIIAFSAVILSGYFKEAKDLHEDNEMII